MNVFVLEDDFAQQSRIESIVGSLMERHHIQTKKFEVFGIRSKNVYESQALLELKKNYCDYKKCLECAIGHFILKK